MTAREVRDAVALRVVCQKLGIPVRGDRADDGHGPHIAIDETKGLWHNHRTNRGGDAFTLIQDVLDCDFREALHWLADLAGVAVTAPRPEYSERRAKAQDEAGELVEWLAGLTAHLRDVRNFIFDDSNRLDRWTTEQGQFTDDPAWLEVAKVPERRRLAGGIDGYIDKLETLSAAELFELRKRLEGTDAAA